MKEKTSWHKRARRLGRRSERYREVVAWLAQDGLWRFRRRVILILLATLSGTGLQLAAFGLIFALARALERDTEFSWLGHAVMLRDAPGPLLGVSVGVALCLVAAAGLLYGARTEAIRLRRRYDEFCAKRAWMLAGHMPLPTADAANRVLAEEGLSRIAHRYARACSRVLYIFINGSLPLGRALVALGVMAFINATWSLIILMLAPVAGYLLYGVNVSAAKSSWRRDRHAAPASGARRRLLARLSGPALSSDTSDEAVTDFYKDTSRKKVTDSFYDRFFIRERAQLVTHLFTALVVLVILWVAGAQVFRGGMSWTVFAAYLLALRFFLTSIRGVVGIFVKVSRFYPTLRNYKDFVEDASRVQDTVQIDRTSRTVELALSDLENGKENLCVRPGQRMWLLTPDRVDRALAARLQLHTVSNTGEPPASYWFATNPEELEEGCAAPHSAVLTASGVLHALEPERQRTVLHALEERVVIMAVRSLSDLERDDDIVLLLNTEALKESGWCTVEWIRAHEERWSKWMEQRAARAAWSEDDEDEDEE